MATDHSTDSTRAHKPGPGRGRKSPPCQGKVCPSCGEFKLASEYRPVRHRGSGVSWECKKCMSIREARNRKLHGRPDRSKEFATRRSRVWTNKMCIITHYGGHCKCCGESRPEFLTLDHINNDGASHRKILRSQGISSHRRFYKWVIDSGFPDTLRLLCFNCNCASGFFGYCPHEKEREAKSG